MAPIRVAVVGAGRFAPAHLRAYGRRDDVRVVAIVNRTERRAVELAETFSIPSVYRDYVEMIKNVAPDAISVVTASEAHEGAVMYALQRDVAVLVEKPVAEEATVAERMAESAERTGTPLLAAHILRYAAPHRAVARALRDGILGGLVAIAARRDRSLAIAKTYGTHPALLTAIHDIDLILWLSHSRVIRVRALETHVAGVKLPVLVSALAELADGTLASLSTAMLHRESESQVVSDRLDVYGTAGISTVETTGARARLQTPTENWEIHDPLTPPDGAGAMGAQVDHFLELVRTRSQSAVVPLLDVVRGIKAAEAVMRSASRSGEVIEC